MRVLPHSLSQESEIHGDLSDIGGEISYRNLVMVIERSIAIVIDLKISLRRGVMESSITIKMGISVTVTP